MAALFLGFLGCNEQEKDVQPGQQQTASESDPQFHHDGTDPCPIEDDECQEHCGEYTIELGSQLASCLDSPLYVYYDWEDCPSREGFCVEVTANGSNVLENHCACCDVSGSGIEPQSGHFECAQTNLWGYPEQEKIINGNSVYSEFDEPLYETPSCGEVNEDIECCQYGYSVEYDPSTQTVTIDCI